MLTIYKASAGSGKTYTLARDYILLLLGIKDDAGKPRLNLVADGSAYHMRVNNKHRNILAITFTRKATEEMKSRIVSELKQLSLLPAPGHRDANYADYLTEELSCSRQLLAVAAGMALSQLLFDYQNFNVSTIDSFFQRVLKTFARELDRQTDYQIEIDDLTMMAEAINVMLNEFNRESQPGDVLEGWIYNHIRENFDKGNKTNLFNRNSKIYKTLVKSMTNITEEKFKQFLPDMKEYLATDKLARFKKAIDTVIGTILGKLKAELEASFSGVRNPFPREGLGASSRFHSIYEHILSGERIEGKDIPKLKPDVVEKYYDKSPYNKGKITSDELVNFCNFCEKANEAYARISDLEAIRGSLTMLELLQHAWKYLDSIGSENNRFLLSDTNELVQRIIGADETPFVYERMGVQLTNFLLDEFQDTSYLQWKNLQPLVENGIAEQDSLVIGDEKQSIYRFRNSDSSLLHHKVGDHFGANCQYKGNEPHENTNYRTCATIVDFNNKLFSQLASECKVDGYENVVQNISEKHRDHNGYISLTYYNKDAVGAEKVAEDDPLRQDNKTIIFRQMAQQMLRLHNEGKYRWRDIAVLTNDNPQAGEVAAFLLQNYADQIPVATQESLCIANSSAVQLVITILKIFDQENQRPKYQKGVSLEKKNEMTKSMNVLHLLEYIIASTNATPTEALKQAIAETSKDESNDIVTVLQAQKTSSLIALIETIIAKYVPAAEKDDQAMYIAAFQDLVTDYSNADNGSLYSFLKWWDAEGCKKHIAGAAGDDAVQVMTLHKSKGLEFECVIMPFCSWKFHHGSNSLWTALPSGTGIEPDICPPAIYLSLGNKMDNPASIFHDTYASERKLEVVDCLNKTYVGFTRAISELLIWYTDGSDTIGQPIQKYISKAYHEYDPATKCLTIGAPTTKRAEEIEKDNAIDDQLAKTSNIAYESHMRDDTTDYTCVDDALDTVEDNDYDDSDDDGDDDNNIRQEGIVLHDIMAKVGRIDSLDQAMAAAKLKYRLDPSQIVAFSKIAQKFLDTPDPLIKRWFADYKKIFVEQPIYIKAKDIVKRPDRVVVCDDGVVDVIDYKFTTDPAHIGEPKHKSQVATYMRAMGEMGYKRTRGFLCYPRLSKIIEVNL